MGPELPADLFGVRTIRIVVEGGASRTPLDLLHYKERPIEPFEVGFEIERFRHGKPRRMESAIGVVFEIALGLDQARDGIAPQDEGTLDPRAALLPACPQAKRFAACAAMNARDAASPRCSRRRASDARDRPQRGVRDLPSPSYFAGSRMSLKPDGACGPITICSRMPQPSRFDPSGSVITASEIAWMWRCGGAKLLMSESLNSS